MKVHYAAGEHAHLFPGWHNLDHAAHPGITTVVDLLADGIPDEIQDVDVAYVGHFLEHLYPIEAQSFLLRVRERMAPGGHLVVVGPDVEKVTAMAAAGEVPEGLVAECRAYGEPNGTDRSQCHLWDCTGAAVVGLCESAGWMNVQEQPIQPWPLPDVPCIEDAPWQFLVTASVQ